MGIASKFSSVIDLMRDKKSTELIFDNPDYVRRLRIWFCKYRTLAPLAACINLEELVIAGLPDNSLSFLSDLRSLKYLSILHLPKVSSLEPLASLQSLEVLSLAVNPSWDSSGKRTFVDSLEPIATLPKLKYLELFRVCPRDLALRDLENSASLLSVRVSGYPKSEVERFRELYAFTDKRVPASSWASESRIEECGESGK